METDTPTLGAAASGMFVDIDVEEARQLLREAQAALAGLGYAITQHDDPGHGIDGVWGPITRDAVAQYQRDNDLPETGALDRDTFESITSAASDGMAAESRAPTEDNDMEASANEILRAQGDTAISEQLGEPTDDDPEIL